MKILLPLLFLALPSLAQDKGTKDFPPPEPNRPWLHPKSGLYFPAEIAGMKCEAITDWVGDPALGQSLRYVNRDLRIRADVYVFPCPHPLTTPAEFKEAAGIEAGNVLAGLEQMKDRGVYSKIHQNDATYKEIDLYPDGSGKTGWLEFSVNATIHEDAGAGKSEEKVFSYAGITIFKGHFVKIRCTVPAEDNKEREKQLSEFVSDVRFLVFMDPGMRAEVKQHIQTYRSDPFSDKAAKAAAFVMTYLKETPTLSVSVSSKVMNLGDDLKPLAPEADMEVLKAFLVGAVEAGIQDPPPKTLDLEQGGALEILRLYDALKKKHPKLQSAEMDTLAKATKIGKGGEWLLEEKPP